MIYYYSLLLVIMFVKYCLCYENMININQIFDSELSNIINGKNAINLEIKQSMSNMELYCGVSNKCRQYYKYFFMKLYNVNDMNCKRYNYIIVNFNDEVNVKKINLMFVRNKYLVLLYYRYKYHSILQSSVICNIEKELVLNFDKVIQISDIYITDEVNYKILWIGIPTILISSDHVSVEKGILYCNTFKELYQTINLIESYPHTITQLQNDLAKYLYSKSFIFNQKKYIYYQFVHLKMKDELKLVNKSSQMMKNIYVNTNSHNFISFPPIDIVLYDCLYKYVKINQQYSIAENVFVRLLHISNNNNPKTYELFISIVNQTENSDEKLVYLYTYLLCCLEKRRENFDFVAEQMDKHFMNSLNLELYYDMVNFTNNKFCYNGLKYYSFFIDKVEESHTYGYVDLLIKMKYLFLENKIVYINIILIVNRLKRIIELFPTSKFIYSYVYDIKKDIDGDVVYPNEFTAMIPNACNNEYEYFCLYKNRITIPDDRKLLIFYIMENNIWFKPFGPSLLGGFLGGSEESLIEELGELGYWVEVYCEIKLSDQFKPKFTKSGGCIIWYPIACLKLPLKSIKNLLLFVIFRSFHGLHLVDKNRDYKTVVWLTDVPKWLKNSMWINTFVDYFIVMSEFHKSLMKKSYILNAQLYTNHLDLPLMNKNNIFIYASQPNRGLDRLVSIWDYIHKKIPGSELHVFYDFHKNYVKYLKKMVEEDVINSLLYCLYTKPGIVLHGGANQDELSYYFSKSGFLLYPTSYPEVGCLTCIKAMSYGCIPITSLFNESVIPEITKEFDLGCEIGDDLNDFLINYSNRIIEAVKMNLTEKRIKMKEWVIKKYSLNATIKVWKTIISEFSNKKQKCVNNNNKV